MNSIMDLSNYSTHEEFVNSNGTSPTEIVLISFIMPGSSLLLSLIPATYFTFINSNLITATFLSICLLLVFTILSDHLAILLLILVLGILATVFIIFDGNQKYSSTEIINFQNWISLWNMPVKFSGHHLPFLTDYRGHLLLATAIAILAVDFSVFPRCFSKTEMYGWSVMDAGVGCFVIVNGICSIHSRENIINRFSCMWKSILSSFPLLILGILRLVATKAVNYHENVKEYGVHWNFFFTLAIVKIICSATIYAVPWCRSGLLAAGVAIIHQWILSTYSITEFILNDKRETFFQANKEGICSILGFVAIYFEGAEIGRFLRKPRCRLSEWINACFILLTLGITSWMAMCVFHKCVQPVSRRMANSSYCVWMLCLGCIQLAIHLISQLAMMILELRMQLNLLNGSNPSYPQDQFATMKSCVLWKAISQNALLYFLLANVLTGIVNMFIETTKASTGFAMIILTIYVLTLSAVAMALEKFSLYIKF